MTYATPWHHLAGISVAAFFAVVVTPTEAQEQKFKAVSVKTPDGLTISAQVRTGPKFSSSMASRKAICLGSSK